MWKILAKRLPADCRVFGCFRSLSSNNNLSANCRLQIFNGVSMFHTLSQIDAETHFYGCQIILWKSNTWGFLIDIQKMRHPFVDGIINDVNWLTQFQFTVIPTISEISQCFLVASCGLPERGASFVLCYDETIKKKQTSIWPFISCKTYHTTAFHQQCFSHQETILYQYTKFTFLHYKKNIRGRFALRATNWEQWDEMLWNFDGILVNVSGLWQGQRFLFSTIRQLAKDFLRHVL